MEPNKEAISVRLARLSNQFLGRSSLLGSSVHVLKRSLNREGLLDALTVLYDECNNDSLKRSDEQISKFVDKYRCVLTELRRLRVNISDFEVKDIIGRGYFGEVHVVREKHTGDVYAMKTLRKDATLKQKDVTFYEEERDIMALASSNWITKLQYAFQDSAQLYLVMEFCPGGDLAGLLDRRGRPLPESDASFYLAELNQAINTLHLMGYVHRDIKPDNVLIDRCGHLKLADFGSAARISQTGKVTSAMPIGTPDYIAPELLKSMESVKPQSHGAPCDYWSLGIVAYEFVTLCTPFVDADKPDSIVHTYNNIMQHGSKCQLVKFPADVEASVSQEYKDLVQCLLAVDEKKRFGYFETLKHQVFKDIPWNTIRDQVPPFVPIVSAVDDTSHFVEYEKQANQPSVTNFRTRSQFSGRNLPFIGFTYAHEPILPFYSHNNTHSSSGDAYADSESCSSHAQEGNTVPVTSENRGSNNGFMNSSFNNRTAINVGSVREMECLLESRKKEIESLQKKLASTETEAFLFADKERRLTEAENERGRLELEITELVVQNKKLTRQLELEHEDRKDLETKSLELINAAKKSWMSKTKVQVESLTANVASHEARARELTLEKETLVATVKALRGDLEKANVEIDCMKKLQSNYKDSMAKARKVSRQSIVGLEHMSAESNNQIQTLTQSLNRELETRRAIEAQLTGLREQVKTCRDREKNLIVELEENKKDFSDLKKECEDSAKLRSTIENLEFELSSLRRKASRAERGENKMVQNLEETLAKEKLVIETQKKEIKDLQSTLQQLEHALEQQRSAESTMEEQHGRTLARLQEKIGAAQQDRIDLQARLDATVKSEERHKDKVADLENLVMRLEQEVSKLERQNQSKPSQSDDKLSEGKVILLQEQLGKMEQQLSTAREELLVHKQEARKANTAQWKKEKELSELELDKKILTRELKQAEEQLKKITKEKKSLSDRLAEKVKVLEEKASEQNELVVKLRKDAEDGGRAREDVEVTLREVNGRLDEERKKVEKYVAEVERCKADIRKLKCELQYSENRRSKAESVVDDLREELKMAEALHHQQREEAVKLRVTLDERVREGENLIANNKMLQDACTMLEEQLIDFEKLSEVQESKTQSMKCEVVTMRAEMERYKQKLSEAQQQASHTEKQVERAHEEKMAARALEDESRRTVNELENRIADLQNKITTLTEELEQKHLLLTEGELARASLTRRLSSQAGELAGLKEECAALRTNVHRLKEENMQVALRLQEAEENNATLKCMVEEKRSELDAQAAHHRQRELKADATLQQLTKLIDFLQTKIEESGRRKKMFAGMFGKSNGSTLKELGAAPGTPHTPSGNNLAELGRNLHKERSRNRELKEQLAMLKHKLDSLQGKHGSPTNIDEPDTVCDTPRSHYVSNALQRSINREGVSTSEMEGWIRIAKGSLLERVYLVLSEGRLSWYDDCPTAASSTQLGAVVVGGESTRVTSHIGGDTGLVQLSENDRKCAFVINTDNWQQKSLLFVCASSHQQVRWLRALEPLVSAAPAPRIHLRCYEPTLLLRGGQWLGVNCVVQLEDEIYVLGTDQGLHSHQPSQPAPLPLGGPPSVLSIRLAPHIGQALLVTGTRRLAHCGLRELASRARRSAGVAGALACRDVCLDGERADVWQCMHFEISPARYGTDRVILCVAGTKKLILMLWDFSKCHFKQLRIMDLTSPVTCLLFTRHTILVGTNKLYEMDLTSYTTEEFLDASDISLTAAVYAYKKNLYPMSIIRIKEQKIDDMTEYLICYKEFGFFVDEFGHRTRTEDVKWTHTPLEFSFRKPFLFVLYDDKVDVLYVDDKAYQLPPCECNCETSSVSTFSSCTSADKVRIQLENPKLMGKSMNQGCIFIKTGSDESKQADIIEFNGNDAFRKDIGLSIETLDTAEDNDSCKNVKNVDSNEYDVESVLSIDSAAECRTDFSANIRQRAKQIVTQHREKTDEHKITSILSKEVTKKFVPRSERENCTSEGSVSDSEFSVDSSDAENSNGAVYADTAAGRLRNGEQVRTTAEICTDMFLKKVRFDKK